MITSMMKQTEFVTFARVEWSFFVIFESNLKIKVRTIILICCISHTCMSSRTIIFIILRSTI